VTGPFDLLIPNCLNAERRSAPASALGVGVLELEACCFEGFDVVDDAAVEVHERSGVDKDLECAEVKDLVHHAGLVLKRHGVLEAGASAADDANAQAGRERILGRHDLTHLFGGRVGKSERRNGLEGVGSGHEGLW